MSQQVTEPSSSARRVLLPRPRRAAAPGRPALVGALRTAPWVSRVEEQGPEGARADGPRAERLDRREALLHRLELDRQRRRYRSA